MFPRFVLSGCLSATFAAGTVACSSADPGRVATAGGDVAAPAAASPANAPVTAATAVSQNLTPNEMGRIPVFEYHLVVPKNGLYERTPEGLRRDLETMYQRGYRPVSISEMLDRKIDLPAGQSPVVLVFDDASPSQFRYIEKNGQLEIDPTSAVGILIAFNKEHADWRNRAVFCMLPAAQPVARSSATRASRGRRASGATRK